jgi:hypothetical protein
MFEGSGGVIDFLCTVENHIHVEVKKLYPDADLPKFQTVVRSSEQLVLDYISCRPLSDLAVGLMLGAAEYFEQNVAISASPIETPTGTKHRFEIRVAAEA